tara:strand:+ start:408 stop:1184 length:777 start_codon:yes stop_codon:yes gene_type:complete
MPLIEPKLEIAKGNYTNHSFIHKVGINDTTSTTYETMWNGGDVYPTIGATGRLLHISSSANQDATGSIGARTLTVEGLDVNYNTVTETIPLTGKALTTSTNSYIALNDAFIATGGTAEQSGSISISLSGSSILGYVDSVYKQSMQAHYTVPANHTAYLQSVNCSVNQVGVPLSSGSFVLYQKPSGSVYRALTFQQSSGTLSGEDMNNAISFSEKTEIDLRVKGNSGPAANGSTGNFALIVVNSNNIPIQGVNFQGFII